MSKAVRVVPGYAASLAIGAAAAAGQWRSLDSLQMANACRLL